MANKTMADYTRKIKPYLEGVAPIEPTSTAASAHSVGDVFYFDGLLVKCTTAISVGDTIIVSPTTNYNVEESDDVVTQIKNGGGGGGTYTAGNGINIDANNVISSDSVIFTGTKAEWEELTLEEKIQYTHAAWVGDEQSGAIDPVPTEDSNNLMTSGGIFNALEEKQNVTDSTLETTSKTIPGAINEILGMIDKGSELVLTDGVKTYRELYNELYSKIDFSKVTTRSYFLRNTTNVMLMSNQYTYTSLVVTNAPYITTATLKATDSTMIEWNGTTTVDYSTSVPAAGYYYGIVY